MTATEATPSEPQYVEGPDDFDRKVSENDVVFVDFFAEWCGPCQMLDPIVEDLAAETPATVLKVDIDEHQQLAAKYQVRGVPTTALFVDGDVQETMVGLRGKEQFADLIESAEN